MAVRFCKLIRAIVIKIDPIPLNPAFQNSIIPSFRSRSQQDSLQSQLFMTKPKGLGFYEKKGIS